MPKKTGSGGRLKVKLNERGRVTIEAELFGILFEEEGMWVSYCPPLDLSTCGHTRREAVENTKEAITLFFEGCLEHGTLDKALTELNWTREEEIVLDGLAKASSARASSATPPAFIIENIKQQGRGWTGRAVFKTS